jgi:Na+-driven multidrug efflux pump
MRCGTAGMADRCIPRLRQLQSAKALAVKRQRAGGRVRKLPEQGGTRLAPGLLWVMGVKLLCALLMLSLPAAAARVSVGVTVVHSTTVSARLGHGAVAVSARGTQPAQVQVAPADAAGDVVVTLLY